MHRPAGGGFAAAPYAAHFVRPLRCGGAEQRPALLKGRPYGAVFTLTA